MSQNKSKEDQPRARVADPLKHSPHEISPVDEVLVSDPARLIEELNIHQAELKVQNDELRRIQIEMHQARDYYKSLFEAIPILAFVLDEKGLILEANQQVLDLLGFRSSINLRQHAIYRLMTLSSSTLLAEALQQPISNEPLRLPDLCIKVFDGGVRNLEPYITRLPQYVAGERRYLLLMIDRTEEKKLAQQSKLYETIVNHASAFIYATDREHRLILANSALLETLKKPLVEVLGHHRSEFMPFEDAKEHEKNDVLVLSTNMSYSYEEKLHVPGSEARYFFSHKFPLYDLDGDTFGVGGITTEITENKIARQRLELAMQVFSQGSEGFLVCDNENKIVSVNKAFEEITGYTESEVLGKDPKILSSGRQGSSFYKDMWTHINNTSKWEGEIWNRRKSGGVYPQWLTISRVKDSQEDSFHYIGVFADITQRKLAEEEIERLAFYDVLTGIPNRFLLKDRFTQALHAASRDKSTIGFAFIDLDHFKEVNDLHGHEVGDLVLKRVVERALKMLRSSDTLARLGGDEFIWIINDISPEELTHRVSALVSCLAEPYSISATCKIDLSASIGVAFYPDDGKDYETLLKHADIAMYEAKSLGKNRYQFFNKQMAEDLQSKYQMESLLRGAIDRNELFVVFQPQFKLADHKIVGLEALLRWNSPELGAVPPDHFIPIAEQTGLINTISDWVLDQVCKQMELWQQQGLNDFTVAINVSAKQFWDESFVERLTNTLNRYGISPSRLELELTERLAMDDVTRSVRKMNALKAMGVRLSIDDFGTGFSSLSYLRWMPVDVLKVDKSFVDDIGIDVDNQLICRSIIQLGKGLGLTVVAEGVERANQERFLITAGCDLVQGYLLARPMPVDEVTRLLCQQHEH